MDDINIAFESSYPTPVSNSPLLPMLILSLARQKNSPDTKSSFKKEYDYVIVGAGAAGSVVAARLSEKSCVSVLLLEAGHGPPHVNDVPAFGRNFWFTDLDWQYKTTPQRHTGRGLQNRQLTWPSGKALGGTTVINDGLFVRGNMKDYDNWAASGATGWSYSDVLPYFKKMEDNKDYPPSLYHGVGGPVTIMRPNYKAEIKEPVNKAAQELGYENIDINAERQTSKTNYVLRAPRPLIFEDQHDFYDPQVNIRDNQRCQTAKAYLVPAENRTNLDILENAMVTKVIISDNVLNRRATGVKFDFNNETHTVMARREVIMSAGTVNTAQLLMLSGVGPLDQLVKYGIPIKAVLPVGRNLQDHGGTTIEALISPNITEFTDKQSEPANIQSYIDNRSGPLCSPEGVSNMAFLYKDAVNPSFDFPNYELYFFEGSTLSQKFQFNLKPEVFQQVYGPYERKPIMACIVQQLHPRSRGRVTLRSNSAYDQPVIDPNYFSDSRDVQDLVDGMKKCKDVLRSPFLKEVGTKLFNTSYPGCEDYVDNEDLYFRCQIRTALITLNHQCGTAKMGNPLDPSTVVDPKLRVKGIRNLRVVDNSIMPTIVSGNTAVPAIMIGEKASDMVKEDIQCQDESDSE